MTLSTPSKPLPLINRAIPNELWEIILEFNSGEHRIFKASIAKNEIEGEFLSSPLKFKSFSFTPNHILWGNSYQLTATYLHEKSDPITPEKLARQYLGLGSKNRAPTNEHPTHHVYIVGMFPFNAKASFSIGESIHGGHGDTGGSRSYSLAQLLNKEDWRADFERADCSWAVPIIEKSAAQDQQTEFLLDTLAAELQRRLEAK
ncbi:MAG: hypothetical protein AB8G95_20075 [Anaerolineae bacterium]